MGKKAPSPPPPPDPVATAQAQGQMNLDTARATNAMNRVNQVTPYGNLGYTSNGDTYTATTTLSPAQQRQLDLTNDAQEVYGTAALNQLRQVQGQLSQPFQFDGPAVQTSVQDRAGALNYLIPGGYEQNLTRDVADRTGQLQRGVQDRTGDVQRSIDLGTRADFTNIGDPNQARSDVEAALFARMQPGLTANRNALEARLINQGITPGSQAWETGMREFGMQENDARYGAVLNAGQEQSRVFGLGFGQTNLRNQAVGQMGEFANNATQQVMTNDLQRGEFANNATQQAFGMDIGRGQFRNAAEGQAQNMFTQRAGFNNQAQQQAFGMDMGRAQFGNAAGQQSLQQQLALRGQPINEAAALLSGQQLQYPQFQNVPQVNIQAPDYQAAVAQNYAGQMQAYNSQMQRQGANNAAIASLIGSVGGAALSGGLGFTPAGLGKLAFGRA